MKRPRFSLSFLLVIVTLVALFFGYSQYRRQRISRAHAELKTHGISGNEYNEWRDLIWQRPPEIVLVNTSTKLQEPNRVKECLYELGYSEKRVNEVWQNVLVLHRHSREQRLGAYK